jgi:hypothetical protein
LQAVVAAAAAQWYFKSPISSFSLLLTNKGDGEKTFFESLFFFLLEWSISVFICLLHKKIDSSMMETFFIAHISIFQLAANKSHQYVPVFHSPLAQARQKEEI